MNWIGRWVPRTPTARRERETVRHVLRTQRLRGARVSGWLVFDAGALIAAERRSTRLQALVQRARDRGVSIVVPTVVVGQVVRGGGRQAGLRRFLGDSVVRFDALDYASALEVGVLLGRTGTSDVVDAAVVVCARARGRCPMVTSDPDDMAALDPAVPLIAL